MDTTRNLKLPYILPSQAQKHVTHNDALDALDAVVQINAQSRNLSEPPAGPVEGSRYVVAGPGEGDWSGHDGEIALAAGGLWSFHTPRPGWLAWIADEALLAVFDGEQWSSATAVDLGAIDMISVNAAVADETNRLAVSSPATLLDHAGHGHQLKLNKNSSSDTASIVLQSSYLGHAELGLAGDNDFQLKVSSDGSTWKEALRCDAGSSRLLAGGLWIGRDLMQNVLPDSGRFNGAGNNMVFFGISYVQPGYLLPTSGAAFAQHAKFIHNNNDYGGSAGSLDAHVRLLIDKLRPSNARRYGPEWYALRMTQAATPAVETQTINGQTYGLVCTNTFTAMPVRYSVGYFLKVNAGSVAVRVNSSLVTRASIDGLPVPAGSAASHVLLNASDGWKHVALQAQPNAYGYEYAALQLFASGSSEVLLAMPVILFGHVDIDPLQGVFMNSRMFG